MFDVSERILDRAAVEITARELYDLVDELRALEAAQEAVLKDILDTLDHGGRLPEGAAKKLKHAARKLGHTDFSVDYRPEQLEAPTESDTASDETNTLPVRPWTTRS